MPKVKYIASPKEIPAEQKYVLVVYGEEHAQTKHLLGLTITVASTASQLSFLTDIHVAKGIARQAGMAEVFVCTAMTPGPNATPRGGMFTYVPAQDKLSSNVIGFGCLQQRQEKHRHDQGHRLRRKRAKRLYYQRWRLSRDGRSLCCCAPVGNQFRCQGQQMACHNERKR